MKKVLLCLLAISQSYISASEKINRILAVYAIPNPTSDCCHPCEFEENGERFRIQRGAALPLEKAYYVETNEYPYIVFKIPKYPLIGGICFLNKPSKRTTPPQSSDELYESVILHEKGPKLIMSGISQQLQPEESRAMYHAIQEREEYIDELQEERKRKLQELKKSGCKQRECNRLWKKIHNTQQNRSHMFSGIKSGIIVPPVLKTMLAYDIYFKTGKRPTYLEVVKYYKKHYLNIPANSEEQPQTTEPAVVDSQGIAHLEANLDDVK